MDNTNDTHVHSLVAGVVMLAAIFTTYTTYSYYQDDKVASNYESDQFASEQTASALMSLKTIKMNLASTTATSTATTTKKSADNKPEPKKVELR